MNAPENPYRKDAEACTKFITTNLRPKKGITPLTDEAFRWLGTWAGHWGRLALKAEHGDAV